MIIINSDSPGVERHAIDWAREFVGCVSFEVDNLGYHAFRANVTISIEGGNYDSLLNSYDEKRRLIREYCAEAGRNFIDITTTSLKNPTVSAAKRICQSIIPKRVYITGPSVTAPTQEDTWQILNEIFEPGLLTSAIEYDFASEIKEGLYQVTPEEYIMEYYDRYVGLGLSVETLTSMLNQRLNKS